MKQHTQTITVILLLVLLVAAESAVAQPGGGGPVGGGGSGCWPPPCIPIDGGMSFLAALGIAFGGKKLLDLRNK